MSTALPDPLGEAVSPTRPRGKPHDPSALAEVRRLIETSALSYRAIARITGVPRATISRHVLEGGWIRPQGGPGADDLPPLSAEAERRVRRGLLAERVLRAAEHLVEQVELNPTATPAAFARAVRVLALAQRLDRPGMPRSRLARAQRVKGDKGSRRSRIQC
ncbi:hypothetical protein HCU64_03295 [Methylobacterium sp. C25]|uniref:hypothetical protein n=1 Tax=Methylobacterium sp. C25 TaxID=2721622 RepID=UPI001F2ACBFF|nr:hypothetical protein [Methylobacterium sp. C25]MCE4222765.1 hypothetical protein [Methylobacterium sp. C25]